MFDCIKEEISVPVSNTPTAREIIADQRKYLGETLNMLTVIRDFLVSPKTDNLLTNIPEPDSFISDCTYNTELAGQICSITKQIVNIMGV